MQFLQTTLLRRWGIVMLTVLVLTVAAGLGQHASAVKDDGAHPRPDYGSKELFKLECEALGGRFWVDQYGNTNCRGSGVWVQCDANGKDCWVTPTGYQPPSDMRPGSPDQGPVMADPIPNQGGASLPGSDPPVVAGP